MVGHGVVVRIVQLAIAVPRQKSNGHKTTGSQALHRALIHMQRARMEINDRAHQYRNEAQRARAFVGGARMPRERELLLEISKEFERLAILCEETPDNERSRLGQTDAQR